MGSTPLPHSRFALSQAHTDALVRKHIPNVCYEHTIPRIPELRNTSRRKLSTEWWCSVWTYVTYDFAEKANHLLHARTNVCV